jgi:hypothetical protein
VSAKDWPAQIPFLGKFQHQTSPSVARTRRQGASLKKGRSSTNKQKPSRNNPKQPRHYSNNNAERTITSSLFDTRLVQFFTGTSDQALPISSQFIPE